jgi:hypothetical protein
VLTAFRNAADATIGPAARSPAASEKRLAVVRRHLELGALSYLGPVSTAQTGG